MYIGHYDWQFWLQVFDWNGQIKNIRQYGSNIYKNARFPETTENQTLHIKEYFQPMKLTWNLLNFFQTRKQTTFPPRLTVLTDVAQVRPSFFFFSLNFEKKPFFLWLLPRKFSLLFKADKSLILMLGCVILRVLIIAIYAAGAPPLAQSH